jgi:hypothetical protein
MKGAENIALRGKKLMLPRTVAEHSKHRCASLHPDCHVGKSSLAGKAFASRNSLATGTFAQGDAGGNSASQPLLVTAISGCGAPAWRNLDLGRLPAISVYNQGRPRS